MATTTRGGVTRGSKKFRLIIYIFPKINFSHYTPELIIKINSKNAFQKVFLFLPLFPLSLPVLLKKSLVTNKLATVAGGRERAWENPSNSKTREPACPPLESNSHSAAVAGGNLCYRHPPTQLTSPHQRDCRVAGRRTIQVGIVQEIMWVGI